MLQRVPATIITSDCRGLGRKMIPKRSRSYRAAPACIISTAQQAKPKVIGHIELVRAQFTRLSTFETTNWAALFGEPDEVLAAELAAVERPFKAEAMLLQVKGEKGPRKAQSKHAT